MPPPFGFTSPASQRSPRFVSWRNWSTTDANASFTSISSMSSHVSFVDSEARAGHRRGAASVLVGRGYVELDRDDLLLEAALVDRSRCALVRFVRVPVGLLARELPLLRDLLGRDSLHDDVEALEH